MSKPQQRSFVRSLKRTSQTKNDNDSTSVAIKSEASPSKPSEPQAGADGLTLQGLSDQLSDLERQLAESRAHIGRINVNNGLRMILVATVLVFLIMAGSTVAEAYFRFQSAQVFINSDQDAMSVMCAIDPPTEREFGRLHLCEVVANGGVEPQKPAKGGE